SLVQRIVYGKLHLGQLDESGLSMSDLRRISDSLRETIRHANHGRIEYPWQKVAQDASTSQSTTNKPTQSTEPRLDSLDRKPNNRQTGMTAAMSGAIELGVADRKSNPKWPEGSGDVNPGRAALGVADTSDLRRDDELAILETAPAVPRHEPPSASREGEWPKLTESAVARIDDYEHERSRTFSAPIAPPIVVAPASIPDEVPAGALPPPPADGRISPSTFAAVTPPVARKRAATLPPTPKAHPPIVSPPPRLSSGPPGAQTLSGGPVPHALPATPSGPTAMPSANLPATPSGPTAVPRANASGTSGPHTIPRTPTTLAGASPPGATTLSGGGSPARPPAEPVGMATLQGPNAPARLPATPNPAQSSASSTPGVGVGPGASAAPHRPSSPSANPPRTAGPPARVDRENAITNPPPLRRSGLGNDPPTLRNTPVPMEATRLPGVILGVDEDRRTTSPLLPVQQPPVTYVGHVGPFESPFDSDDAARTEPTMPAFELPLRAPPTKPPPHQDWKTSLAARIDAKLDGDEWSTETPVVPPTKAELRALLGAPDPTRKLSLDELERLHRAVDETPSEPEVLLRRPGSKTAEVDAEQIEAAIELAPPARNRPPTAIGVAKPKKPE
ncbi:MAG: hypothetical protein ABI867_33825, partial [Kofleriaceae bacterium]